MSYKALLKEAEGLEKKATLLRQQAEEEHQKDRKNNIEAWLNYTFKSSSSPTEEWIEFYKQIKKELKKIEGYELLNCSRGHFYFSAFLKNKHTGKLVYICCSDVRYFPDSWYDYLLIRTAEHDKDYTGGSNCYTSFRKIKEVADKLTA